MVSVAAIHDFAQQIARDYRPHRIILFGSHAAGEHRPDSDVDLMVLMPMSDTPFRTALDILNRLDPPFSVDLIVREPSDAEARYRFGDPLIREAFDRGRVLYEDSA